MRGRHAHRVTRLPLLLSLISSLLLTFGTSQTTRTFARAITAAPTSVTIAGDLQQSDGCAGNWDPTCTATDMAAGPDGVYRLTLNLPAGGSFNYKVAIDHAWTENYGLHAQPGGANIPLAVPGSAGTTAVKFYYDPVTHWVTDNVNSVIVTAAGSFQNEIGCPGDWQPDCLKSWLEDIDGDGTYTFNTPVGMRQTDGDTPATHFEFKAALNENWTESYGAGGGSNNVTFDLTNAKQYAVLSFVAATHVPTAAIKSTKPSHDNNVEYAGLAHDTRNSLYRVPFGAVNPGTPVMLRFRTFHDDVTGVTISLYDTAIGYENRQPMTLAARDVDCADAALTAQNYTCDYYQYTYTPHALGTVYYRFIAVDGTATAYYADTVNAYDGLGVATPDEQKNGFRLNVVDPAFKIIPWMQNGVMYQIFPDRFRNGNPANDPKPTDPRYAYPAPPNATAQQAQDAAAAQIVNKKWNQLPEGYCHNYDSPATPCAESPAGRDYFGGDLQGVDQKLNYLSALGITILYLNPIFESGSNHGYDTRDYLQVSRYFGGNAAFKQLVADARHRGITIVLDGVFNHLSSDSPFFDRYHHYASVGACESTASPYRSWFTFHDVAPGSGVCVDSQNRANAATYDGWAGFDSIPVITKRDPVNPAQPYAPVAQYFYQNAQSSVATYWLRQGIGGWRFDVMTDPSFPTAYWQQLRTITKGINPDETLIAEAWHWYDNLPLTQGDQADTAMGYRFRNAVLGLLGATDNKGFPQETDPNLPPSVFANRILSMREDYADATWYTFQNLLDSHDTARLLWSLTPGQSNQQDKELNAANLALGKQRQRIAALVQMTMPGTPDIYYGDEVALTGADDPDDRRAFPWAVDANGTYVGSNSWPYFDAQGNHSMLNWYRELIGIRALNPALRQGALRFLLTDDANKTLAYAMRTKNAVVITVINRNETTAQAINVPTAGYLRDGVRFVDLLSVYPSFSASSLVTTSGGMLHSAVLPPLGAAIFVMIPGQTINGPAAPTSLTATAHNGLTSTVSLAWPASAGAAGYTIYRSPVQGGGYVKVAGGAGTTYTDTGVQNGTTYYYVVRAVDAAGNEGGDSPEANASPAFPIGYAVVQWPKTINQVISTAYTTIYGQVYIQGVTDTGGDPSLLAAQVAFGPQGSDPATWAWQDMAFNVQSGNNFEYKRDIRAGSTGTYNYLVRFSDDNRHTWVYGDQNGIGTTTPGVMTITPSSDTTAPSAPVAAIDYSASSLTVSWTAASDPDGPVAEYHIFRGTNAGGEDATPLAIVPGNTLSYVDTTVSTGLTYYYIVRAYDNSLNASTPSNEVSHVVAAKIVQVTFKVKVPAYTPVADTVYISGSPDPLCNYCGGGTAATAMHETAPGSHVWQITLGIPDGTAIQYKYTRGTYDYVEEWGSITGFTNRMATVHANSPADLTQLFDDSSDANPDDNHKAVQNWRDALVTGTSAASNAITATFNWDVKPAGADFSNAISVQSSGGAVAGTVTHNAAGQSLTFTPNSPLAHGVYTVTVDHVVSLTAQSDGIAIRTPYSFTITI